ncbi:hypothetical protein C5E45_32660, partial [Nocardia nova]
DTETGGRFGTGNMADALAARGALPGLGGPDDYSVAWMIGGPAGGHAAGTVPGGTGFEMGGARGNGQFGGGAALASDSQFTEQRHFPASMFVGTSAGTNAATTPSTPGTTPSTPTGTGGTGGEQRTRLKTFEELGSDFGGIFAKGLLETFGLENSVLADPNKLLGDDGSNVRTTDSQTSSGATPATPATPQATTPPPASTGTGTGDPNNAVPVDPRAGLSGSDLYAYNIADIAKSLGLGEAAATIGTAVGLVESELQMYANSNVPESLSYPHDAVGNDHDSLNYMQQRPSMGWGSIADLMDPVYPAKAFFGELQKIDWQSMDPGAAAQAVQRSAFPDLYGKRMDDAAGRVKKTGLFDTGGFLQPGGLALSLLDKPEPLLPADKWAVAEANIGAADRLVQELGGRGPARRGGDTYVAYGYTAGDIASEWQRKQWARTGGYSGRTWK